MPRRSTRQSTLLLLRLSRQEKAAVQRAAKAAGYGPRGVSTFVRRVLFDAIGLEGGQVERPIGRPPRTGDGRTV